MTSYRIITGIGVFGALVITPVAEAQQVATPLPAPAVSGPAQPGDLDLSCSALAVEMGKAAQLMAQATAVVAPAGAATPVPSGALANLASAVGGTDKLEQIGRAYQQQQNAQQLANLQMLAARGGVNRGAATAAIGGLAALQQVAANGGNAGDAARSVASDTVSNELAKRIPGGKMLGGLMGGMFKKKPKPVAIAAAPVPAANLAQARMAFLGSLLTARQCK